MPVLCTKKTAVGLKIAIFGLCVPVVFLLLLEGTLRVLNYGWPTHFFKKQQINGQECYVSNYKFSWRFFPRPMARLSSPLVVPVHKAPGTIRIFILGSSAAMGDPEPSFAFGRHLEVMLKERFPGKKIEIYNTAATAINSNVVLPIARDCLDLEPDLFVIYTGNNEVVGPYGPSAVLAPFLANRALIKLQVAIGQTKIGQLLQTFPKSASTPQEWGGMELFLEHKVAHDSPELRPVYSHYHDNLAEICQCAQHKGVKVVLSTLIVNERDCAPFVSLHKPGIDDASLQKFAALYQTGQKLEASEQWRQAIQSYTQAAAIDESYAELQFCLGHCYLHLNQTNEARQCLAKARDFDGLRFRADSQMNEIARKVAREQGVLLADADAAARRIAPEGIPGATLLYEHVHLNFQGNYVLANCVLDQTEKALGLKSSIEKPSVDECKKRLAFTVFSEKQTASALLERFQTAPFANQLNNASEVKQLTPHIADLKARLDATGLAAAEETYRNAIAANPNDWWLHQNYMSFLYDSGRYAEALQQAQTIFKQIPFAYLSMVNMGTMLQKVRKFDESEDYFNRAITFNPYFRDAYKKRVSLYEDERKFEAAEVYYQTSSPMDLPGFYNRTGVVYAKERQFDIAIDYFKRALVLQPDFADAEKNLKNCQQRKEKGTIMTADPEAAAFFNQANRLLRNKDYSQAIELYKKAVAKDSEFAKAHNNLGIALVQVQAYDEAEKQFNEAIRLGISDVEPNLAGVLSLQGKHEEAIKLLRKAIAVKGSLPLYEFLGEEYQKAGKSDEAQQWLAKAKDSSTPQ